MLWLMLWLLWMLLVRWRLGGARQDSWHNHLLTWHQDNMRTSHITHYILPHITHATHVWWPLNIIKVGYNPLISEDISIRHAKLRLRLGQFVFNALFEMVAAYRQLPQGLHNIVTHCLYVCIALYFTLHMIQATVSVFAPDDAGVMSAQISRSWHSLSWGSEAAAPSCRYS